MAEFPYLPLFTDAYLGDTTHLTMEQSGCYLHLIMVSWRTDTCDLPDNDLMFSRICRMTMARWLKMRPVLEPFFVIENGRWAQRRLQKEKILSREKCEKMRENAFAKWRKHKETSDANADAPIPIITEKKERKKEYPLQDIPKKESSDADASPSPNGEPALSMVHVRSNQSQEAVKVWNAMAQRNGLPTCQKLTTARRSKLQARLRDAGGLAGWCSAVERVEGVPGLRGDNDRGWKATIDFLLQESSFTRLMEGGYDHWRGTKRRSKTDEVKELLKSWNM